MIESNRNYDCVYKTVFKASNCDKNRDRFTKNTKLASRTIYSTSWYCNPHHGDWPIKCFLVVCEVSDTLVITLNYTW